MAGPGVQIARLIEHRLPDGSTIFSGSHAGVRWRLEPTSGKVSKGDARKVWRLVVETVERPKSVKSRPRAKRGSASTGTGARKKAAEQRREADQRAVQLMRDIGVDPNAPPPSDALPW